MTLRADGISLESRLDGVSASLEEGQITAICGPNGAGKSTLLSALAGLLRPDSGSIAIDEELTTQLHPKERARRIGYLPQDGEVAWDISVRNLIELGRLPHGDTEPAAVDAAIDALDLSDLASRPVSQLSGGEKARALLGRVLAGEPGWILADEPLAALDLAHQQALIAHLRSQADQGIGVVVVLHDLALARNHADRVLVLDKGRLAVDDAPEFALSGEQIRRVWGVETTWLEQDGGYALLA